MYAPDKQQPAADAAGRRPTRVAVVLVSPGLGGTERRLASLTRYLRHTDDKQLAFVINDELLGLLERVGLTIECESVVLRSWFGPASAPAERLLSLASRAMRKMRTVANHLLLSAQLGLVLARLRPDVIQLVMPSALLMFVPYLLWNRAALVVSLVGELGFLPSMSVMARWALRLNLGRADMVDALSAELRDLAVVEHLVPAERIRVQDSFVECDKFVPASEKVRSVVFAARLIPDKNPLLFLEAVPELIRVLGSDVRCFLFGAGPLERAVRSKIAELGIGSYVTTGFQANIGDVLSRSMVFCSLQGRENYPSRSLLEAMACGNAIVATDVGMTHKLVDCRTGIRVPATSKAIADAVIQLLDDPEHALELGRAARELVVREFSPERYRARLMNVYDDALRARDTGQYDAG